MARQGSLCPPIFASRWFQSALCCLCVAIFVQGSVASAALPNNDQVDLRLLYQWETPNAQYWNVSLRVIDDNGPARPISEIENQCESPLTTGAFDVSANEVSFRPRYPQDRGSVQLRIRASRSAKVAIQIRSSTRWETTEGSTVTREIPLLDLIESGSIGQEAGEPATQQGWSLSRIPEDTLRVDRVDQSKYYQPGSDFHFRVQANHWKEFASQNLSLQYSLVRVNRGEVVRSHRWPLVIHSRGNSEAIEIQEQVPDEPGVYEVRCEVVKDDENIWSRFRRREAPLRRVGRPFVVLPGEAADPIANDKTASIWEAVGTLRPSESSWSVGQWLPEQTTRLIPGQVVSNQPELPKQKYQDETLSLINQGKAFQATLPVLKPGYPHKLTLRVPSDRSSHVRVEIAPPNGKANPILSFVIATDTDEVQGKWRTHTFVHYPRSDDDQIWLTNLDDSEAFAFESVKVTAGPSELSSQQTVTSNHRSALLRVTDSQWIESLSKDVATRSVLNDCVEETVSLYRTWVAARRLRDYATANGMNGVVLPASRRGATDYDTKLFYPIRSSDRETLVGLIRLLAKPSFQVQVALKPNMLLSGLERTLRENTSMTRVLTRASQGAADQYNLLHPVVQRELVEVVAELHDQCESLPNFGGIVLNCEAGSHLQPWSDPDQDSAVLMLFAKSSQRIAGPKLQTWVQSEGKAEFARWIESQTENVLGSIVLRASSQPIYALTDAKSILSGLPENLFATTNFLCGASRSPAKQASIQQQNVVAPESTTVVAAISQPSVAEELETTNASVIRTRIGKDVCRVIDRANPSVLIVEHSLLGRRLDRDLRQVLAAVSELPAPNQMNQVAPSDPAAQTVHVSSGIGDEGHLYLLIVSLAPWESEVELPESGVKWSLIDDASLSETKLESVGSRLRVTLPAGRLAVLKSNDPISPNIELSKWSVRLGGGIGALDQIKTNVTAIVERIGTLADLDPSGRLRNGGFEQSGGIGLVGWLHAQHPPGCVQVDQSVASEGKYSVRMTADETTGTRTWMVSETIEPPNSGRLAVSLACRAEARDDSSVHQLRVSIEATRKGTPVRYAKEFDVPRDGQWTDRAILLEIDEIDPTIVDTLRLTIDSLSGGQVWVDDVRLHDEFPTTKERTELQGQAFLAVQGLQRGNLMASARLLQNDWARYLLTLEPTEKPKPVEKKRVEISEESPGVAERIRSWLPRPLRF